jgi:uroporphyrinogen decarboxylase
MPLPFIYLQNQLLFMINLQTKNRRTVNYLKTIYFDYPEWTHCTVDFLPAVWIKHGPELEKIVLAHPRVFPGYKKGDIDFRFQTMANPLYEEGVRTDTWGTVWKNAERGLDSYPVQYPLTNWEKFEQYPFPDPLTDDTFAARDWNKIEKILNEAKTKGDLAVCNGLPHGFMYMRLYYLRGFENFMMDMAAEEPRLWQLITIIEQYNLTVINKYLQLGADFFDFGDDLGLQTSLPMSRGMWQKYIKPSYLRMFQPIRQAGLPVRLHTDGNILAIIPDLIESGVSLLNVQLRANGLENLRNQARGRIALHQDLDRQLFPFVNPSEIEDHIGEVVEALYLPQGGLMIYAECGPDVPLDNIDAVCSALEKFCKLPHPDVD